MQINCTVVDNQNEDYRETWNPDGKPPPPSSSPLLAHSDISLTVYLQDIFPPPGYTQGSLDITLLLFFFTDLDPCINVSCKYFAVCKAFGPKDARCICVDNCPSFEEPVCSSNGTTYDNECVFQREMCHLKANFTVYHPGDCTGNITESEVQ